MWAVRYDWLIIFDQEHGRFTWALHDNITAYSNMRQPNLVPWLLQQPWYRIGVFKQLSQYSEYQ